MIIPIKPYLEIRELLKIAQIRSTPKNTLPDLTISVTDFQIIWSVALEQTPKYLEHLQPTPNYDIMLYTYCTRIHPKCMMVGIDQNQTRPNLTFDPR